MVDIAKLIRQLDIVAVDSLKLTAKEKQRAMELLVQLLQKLMQDDSVKKQRLKEMANSQKTTRSNQLQAKTSRAALQRKRNTSGSRTSQKTVKTERPE